MGAYEVFKVLWSLALVAGIGFLMRRQRESQAETKEMLRKICMHLPDGEFIGVGKHADGQAANASRSDEGR